MDKIDEARAALDKIRQKHSLGDAGSQSEVMEAGDAYALTAHVGTCGIRQDGQNEFRICSEDGWYCDGAKRYMKEAAG